MESDMQNNQVVEESIPTKPQLSSDLIRWMIDADKIAEDIEVDLTGRKLYNGKLVVVNPHKKRMINDEGINTLKILITSHIGKGTINSNLKYDEIMDIMRDLWAIVSNNLYLHRKQWAVEKSDCQTIRAVIVNNVLFAIKRAEEGNQFNKWTSTVKHTSVYNPTQKKSGFLGWMGLK